MKNDDIHMKSDIYHILNSVHIAATSTIQIHRVTKWILALGTLSSGPFVFSFFGGIEKLFNNGISSEYGISVEDQSN